jgi:hypothetical protein
MVMVLFLRKPLSASGPWNVLYVIWVVRLLLLLLEKITDHLGSHKGYKSTCTFLHLLNCYPE